MNRILSWFYRFRPIRLAWWRLKKHRNEDFNDREEIQERIDSGASLITLPKELYNIDHTIHFGSNTMLLGTYRGSETSTRDVE